MRVKALFREYDYPNNIVSGTAGSTELIGTGTHFTELKAGTIIEVEGYGFAGKIASDPVSDTSLTLDRPITESFSDKIFWQDWSAYLVALSPTSRKVESKQAGKVSVQVFDTMQLGFYFVPSTLINGVNVYNPVRIAFNDDPPGTLDSRNRYIIRLQAVNKGNIQIPFATNTYDKLVDDIGNYLVASVRGENFETFFEGMINFESITYPILKDSEGEKISSISFDIIDELSAINILDSNSTQRGILQFAKNRISGIESDPYNIGFGYNQYNSQEFGDIYIIYAYKKTYVDNEAAPDYGNPWIQTIPLLNKGETFVSPKLDDPQKYYLVIDSGMITQGDQQFTWIKTFPNLPPNLFNISWAEYIPNCTYYGKQYYSYVDIGIYSTDQYGRSILSSLNAVQILESLIIERWPDLLISSNSLLSFPIPLNYFETLIDDKPLGQQPLEALQFLTDSINAYLFIDRNRNIKIQIRENFSSIPTENDIEIPELYLDESQKKFFWEKIVDCVEINAKSCIKDKNGKYIDGKGIAYPGGKKIEPRNKLTKDIFLDESKLALSNMYIDSNGYLVDPTIPAIAPLPENPTNEQVEQWKASKDIEQGCILNHYAAIIAAEYLNFYGLRHYSYDMKLQIITWNMLSWDLTNTFSYNNQRFFITNLEFDFVAGTCSFKLVSIQGYEYKRENVLICKNPDTALKAALQKTYNNYS